MPERAYTVTEVDALRRAVENKWLYDRYSGPVIEWGAGGVGRVVMSRSYREEEKVTSVEAMMRTHMLAGHTADDLYASEKRAEAAA